MPKYTGRNCTLLVGGNTIGGVISATVSKNKERIEVTSWGDTAKSYVSSLSDGSVSIDFYVDNVPGSSNQSFLANAEGTSVSVIIILDATTTPSTALSGTVYIDEVSFDSSVSDAVTGTLSGTGSLTLSWGTP